MKTLKLLPLFLIAFLFCGHTVTAQEEEEDEFIEELEIEEQNDIEKVTGVFVGVEDGEFVFTYTDEDGEESTISFAKLSPEAIKMYDLRTIKFVGEKFVITFSTENIAEDDDEDMFVSVRTIISLKQL